MRTKTATEPAKIAEYVKRLQRRSDHLKERIESNPTRDLSFDRAEKSALDFAIKRLKKDAPSIFGTSNEVEKIEVTAQNQQEAQWIDRN